MFPKLKELGGLSPEKQRTKPMIYGPICNAQSNLWLKGHKAFAKGLSISCLVLLWVGNLAHIWNSEQAENPSLDKLEETRQSSRHTPVTCQHKTQQNNRIIKIRCTNFNFVISQKSFSNVIAASWGNCALTLILVEHESGRSWCCFTETVYT